MKHLLPILLFLRGALLAATLADTIPVPLPPCVFTGRIMDYDRFGIPPESNLLLRAWKADGTLLAVGALGASEESSRNYRISVPLSSLPSATTVRPGDTVLFTVVYGGITYSQPAIMPNGTIPAAAGIVEADIVLGVDSTGSGVTDEYLELYQLWMAYLGIPGPYDPNADYDGDGRSNYHEFMAGTNPFDAADFFGVKSVADAEAPEETAFTLQFFALRGKSYTVQSTSALTREFPWKKIPFEFVGESATRTVFNPLSTSEEGIKTIRLKAEGSSRFYRVSVE